MKKVDIVSPLAMSSIFGEDIYSASGTANFEIPANTSTSATDTCVLDDGFLPITSLPLDDGGIAPQRKNFNGLFYLSTDQRIYLQNGGFITFDAAVSTAIGGYPKDAILGYMDSNSNFMFVQSVIDDNTYNFVSTPSYIDGSKWKKAISPSDYADTNLSNLTSTGNAKFANPSLSNLNSTGNAKFANPSLSNLNSTGNAKFANPSLSNLNTTGSNKVLPTQTNNSGKYLTTNGTSPSWVSVPYANQSLSNLDATGNAVLAAKEDKSNKITTITSSSTNTQYPSAKAVYTYADSNYAHKSLNNLNSTGEAHFANPTLSNTTPGTAFINKSTGWIMPDYNNMISIDISGMGTTNKNFTVPANGYLQFKQVATNGGDVFFLDDKTVFFWTSAWSYPDSWSNLVLVTAGTHTFRTQYYASRIGGIYFYPFKGGN